MKNPYVWNQVNLSVVYGRGRLINELLSGLPGIPPISYALSGGRRIGKSTVLRAVEQELRSSADQWSAQGIAVVPVYVDGLSLSRPVDPIALWRRLLAEVCTAQGQKPMTESIGSFEDFAVLLRLALAQGDKVVRLIVLFDEIEPVLTETWADGYFGNWRALLSNTPGVSSYISAVFSGAQELVRLRQDVGSPLMDILELRSLGNLGFEDSVRLMKEPVKADWDPQFCNYIYSQSGGQPMLLQYLMQTVCNRMEGSDPVAAAVKAHDAFMESRAWQFSDWWYRDCSPIAQATYRRLPADFSFMPLRDLVQEFGSREANDAIDLLQHVGIVVSDNDGLAFRRAGEMFASWQRTKGVPTSIVGHDPQIYERLLKLNKQYADKYASAWSILKTELPNYSGAVGEIRDTVTLVLHHLAPDGDVIGAAGFKLEAGETRPTRRQRTRFIALKQARSKEVAKALANDVELLEFQYLLLEKSLTTAYGIASSLTHTTSTRDLAYQSLKQGDSILAQLLE